MDTDRNLLFAVLALQAGVIDRDRFIEACALWATRKEVSIGQLLVERGWLTADARNIVEQLLELQLRRHDGDARASLIAAARSEACGALASIADADVQQSVAALPGFSDPPAGADPYATVPPSEPEGAGRNILYEEIGRGGMGRVMRGRDNDLRRELAVKVLREEYSGNTEVERRFVEEAQIGGQLQHPGIVPVYELGRFSDRRPFFTMKLVKGRTLAELLKQRPDVAHEQARWLTVFEQVCQTVAYAHSKGVIHRDLKPSNVMVGAFGEVQVMDWGLAKVLARPHRASVATTAADPSVLTARDDAMAEGGRTGVIGTPEFMPPEQARGDGEAVDERADVFGLGGILSGILTGQPPFVAANREEKMWKAVTGDTAEAFARLDGCGADAELVTLCKECLAPGRQDRPREAGEVAARVGAYAAAVQERVRKAELERAAAETRAVEERKRRRVSLALTAAVLALVAVGAGGGFLVQHQAAQRQADQARRETEQRQTVEFALEKASGLRDRARWGEAAAVLEQARRVLGDAGSGDLRERLEVADAELALVNRLDIIRQRLATSVEGKFDSRTAEHDYAAAFREAGLGEVGDDEATVAVRVRASGVSGPLVAALDNWASIASEPVSRPWILGVARRAAPDPWADRFRDPAVWRDRQALRALADEAMQDDGTKLDALSPQVVDSLGRLLGGPDAAPLWRAAQRRYPSDFWLNLDLGIALSQAQNSEGVGYLRVAVALRPDANLAYFHLGVALVAMKDWDGAIAEFRKAIELDPKTAFFHFHLGVVLYDKRNLDGSKPHDVEKEPDPKGVGVPLHDKKDLDGAIAEFRKAIELDPNYAPAHNFLRTALYAKNDVDGVIAELRKTIDRDPKAAPAYDDLAHALDAKHEYAAAAECMQKAVELDPRNVEFRFVHGLLLRKAGQPEAAVAAIQKVIDLDPQHARAHLDMGIVFYNRGEFTAARDAIKKALALGLDKPNNPDRAVATWHLKRAESLLALDARLADVFADQAEPADAAERLALGQFCYQYKHRHVAAAHFYADAFAADPKLVADLSQGYRYDAACYAALAAAGQGEDAKNLPDKVRLMLRRQALTWLRADLALYAKLAEREEPATKQTIRQRLGHWQEDTDLASVRDKAALDQLPDDERKERRQLWDDVAALLKKVEQKK